MSVMVVMVVMEDLCVAWYSDTTGILQVTLQPCSQWGGVGGSSRLSAPLPSLQFLQFSAGYPDCRLRCTLEFE